MLHNAANKPLKIMYMPISKCLIGLESSENHQIELVQRIPKVENHQVRMKILGQNPKVVYRHMIFDKWIIDSCSASMSVNEYK